MAKFQNILETVGNFDHRRFGRGFGFVPSWDYGLYDYGCSYGYPTYYGYSCNLSPAY